MKHTEFKIQPQAVLPVAITGMGLVTAAGSTVSENLMSLADGEIAVSPPPFTSAYNYPVFLCPLATQNMTTVPKHCSRTVALALRAAREALVDANIDEHQFCELRTGISIGTSVGASLDFLEFYLAETANESPSLDAITTYLTSNPAGTLGEIFRCHGPLMSITNACSSGADAIGVAAAWIRSGLCDVVLAGGSDALSPITYAGFSSLRLPSTEPCRPFDAFRSGLTLGEAAGFLVLESENSHRKRKARAHAFIAGYGTATDAYHITSPHPENRGLAAAADQALAQAGICWDSVAFINAHGTGTTVNDAVEGAFFRNHCNTIPFIATKGATGHTLGAAGAVETILTIAHLHSGILPVSPRFTTPDPNIGVSPVCVPTQVPGNWAISQSLAFGGNNSVLVIARGEV